MSKHQMNRTSSRKNWLTSESKRESQRTFAKRYGGQLTKLRKTLSNAYSRELYFKVLSAADQSKVSTRTPDWLYLTSITLGTGCHRLNSGLLRINTPEQPSSALPGTDLRSL